MSERQARPAQCDEPDEPQRNSQYQEYSDRERRGSGFVEAKKRQPRNHKELERSDVRWRVWDGGAKVHNQEH